MISAIEHDNLGALIIFQEHFVRELDGVLIVIFLRCCCMRSRVQFTYVIFVKEVNIFLCVFSGEK